MNGKKTIKQAILISAIIFSIGVIKTYAQVATATLSLEIKAGFLTIGFSGTSNLPTITQSPTQQTVTTNFASDSFQVEDKKASCSGYYTSIQSNHLINGGLSIPNTNIEFKATTTPSTVLGSTNTGVIFGSGIKNTRGKIDKPLTYFQRKSNEGCSMIGRYGDTPDFRVTVPANQTGGNYRAKLYYILYDK